MKAGANLPAVAGYNQIVVLDAIRRSPTGISRIEIAASTGLSAMTASNICRRLLADGLVYETGTQTSGVGKPRRILELRPSARFAIGIHLDPSVVSAVLLDLTGVVVDHLSFSTPSSAETTVDEMVAAAERLILEAGIPRHHIMGAGIAAPGPVDTSTGILVNPPLLAGWINMPIRDLLAARLSMPVVLEKDVAAAAIAESWAGTDGENFIFLYYGTGIGMGFAVGNEVVRGSSGNAGDVGSMALGVGGGAAAERSRLGEAVLPLNVVRRAIERGVLDDTSAPLGTTAVRAAFVRLSERALDGDPSALAIVDEIASDLAEGLVAVIDLLDADRVVFGGPFWYPMASLLLERIPRFVTESSYLVLRRRISFVEARVGQDSAAMGAACLILDQAFSPRSSALLISGPALDPGPDGGGPSASSPGAPRVPSE